MLSVLLSAVLVFGGLLIGVHYRTVLGSAAAAALVFAAIAILTRPPLDELSEPRMRLVYSIGQPKSKESAAEVAFKMKAAVLRRVERALPKGAEMEASDSLLEIRARASVEETDVLKSTLAVTGFLEFAEVFDGEDLLKGAVYSAEDKPRGLRFEVENAPLGVGKMAPRYYAFSPIAEGETMPMCLDRLRGWAQTWALPTGKRFAFEAVRHHDPESGTWENEGWRTFVLEDASILTGDDVRDAFAKMSNGQPGQDGWSVMLEFTSRGGALFADATEKLIKRRFAIVVDGIVESAPVVQGRIEGGTAVITMGAGEMEEQMKDAKRLEVILRSGALPCPLTLEKEEQIAPTLSPIALWGLVGLAGLVLLLEVGLAWRLVFRARNV